MQGAGVSVLDSPIPPSGTVVDVEAPCEPVRAPPCPQESQATNEVILESVGRFASVLERLEARVGGYEAANATFMSQLQAMQSRLDCMGSGPAGEVPAAAGVCPPLATEPLQPVVDPLGAARSPRSLVRRLKRKALDDPAVTPVKVRASVFPGLDPDASGYRDSDEEIRARLLSSGASRPGFEGFLTPGTLRRGPGDSASRLEPAGGSSVFVSSPRRLAPESSHAPGASGSGSLSRPPSVFLSPATGISLSDFSFSSSSARRPPSDVRTPAQPRARSPAAPSAPLEPAAPLAPPAPARPLAPAAPPAPVAPPPAPADDSAASLFAKFMAAFKPPAPKEPPAGPSQAPDPVSPAIPSTSHAFPPSSPSSFRPSDSLEETDDPIPASAYSKLRKLFREFYPESFPLASRRSTGSVLTRGTEPESPRLPPLVLADRAREKLSLVNSWLAERANSSRPRSCLLPSFMRFARARSYQVGEVPGLGASASTGPNFSNLVDSFKRQALPSARVTYSQGDIDSQARSAYKVFEVLSFLEWCMGAFGKLIDSLDPSEVVDDLKEFLFVADRAVVLYSNFVMKKRELFCGFLSKSFVANERASLLFSPLIKESLFPPDVLVKLTTELLGKDTHDSVVRPPPSIPVRQRSPLDAPRFRASTSRGSRRPLRGARPDLRRGTSTSSVARKQRK